MLGIIPTPTRWIFFFGSSFHWNSTIKHA